MTTRDPRSPNALEAYVPSGRTGSAALLLTLALAAGAVLVAWIYQWVLESMSVGAAKASVAVLFAAVIGLVCAEAVWPGRIRSRRMALVIGTTVALLAWAASFFWDRPLFAAVVHERLTREREVNDKARRSRRELALSLMKLLSTAPPPEPGSEIPLPEVTPELEFVESFTWSDYLRDKRWVLAAAERGLVRQDRSARVLLGWAFELVIFVVLGAGLASTGVGHPYCERCGAWSRSRELRRASSIDAKRTLEAIEAGDFEGAVDPPRSDRKDDVARYFLAACPRCAESAWLFIGIGVTPATARWYGLGAQGTPWLTLTPARRRRAEDARALKASTRPAED